jgi:hypothetical protein
MEYNVPSDKVLKAIRERLSYDPDTGLVTKIKSGKVYNKTPKNRDYIEIKVSANYDTLCTFAHRIGYYLYYGTWPVSALDHINHITTDNRINNIRLASSGQNGANKKKANNSFSDFKGVHWKKKNKRWCAQIKFNNKVIHIGLFSDQMAAAKAYDEKAKILHGEYACLNFPEEVTK